LHRCILSGLEQAFQKSAEEAPTISTEILLGVYRWIPLQNRFILVSNGKDVCPIDIIIDSGTASTLRSQLTLITTSGFPALSVRAISSLLL
jgi:hypothetical protein